jgi:hypothetical protein
MNDVRIGYLSSGPLTPKPNLPAHLNTSSTQTYPKEGVLPAHRDRQANPLVKLADDPNLTHIEGTISTKAYAATRAPNDPSSSTGPQLTAQERLKPGPGRNSAGLVKPKVKSSLLTATKGALKTIKGKYENIDLAATSSQRENAMEADVATDKTQEPIPPSGQELLQLAGLDSQTADTLPDFEDESLQERRTSPPQIPTSGEVDLELTIESKGIYRERLVHLFLDEVDGLFY